MTGCVQTATMWLILLSVDRLCAQDEVWQLEETGDYKARLINQFHKRKGPAVEQRSVLELRYRFP